MNFLVLVLNNQTFKINVSFFKHIFAPEPVNPELGGSVVTVKILLKRAWP